MFRIIGIIFLVLISGCGGGSSSNISIEIQSDSICAATKIPRTCADSLKLLDSSIQVENHALGGMTMKRLAESNFYQINHQSKYIVLTLGGNDALDNYSEDEYRNEVIKFVNFVRSVGSIPILTGAPIIKAYGPDYFPQTQFFDQSAVDRLTQFNLIIRKICIDMNVPDAHWDTVEFNPLTDTVDGIHRTQEANDRLVLRLYQTITK